MTKKKTSSNLSESVLAEVVVAASGKIGLLTLNSEKTLNSLSLDMVRALTQHLKDWAGDEKIALVVLQGSGHKAFCAGGDVQQLYHSATSAPGGPCEYAEDFFREEYQLNYLIHRYSKPIVCIGHGIVMGGGLGLMAGASHRVVTETSRIAMPEITIGLFPDVGGTYFLNRMPRGLGKFFALTGAPLNARDALYVGLANYALQSSDVDELINQLVGHQWKTNYEDNCSELDLLLKALHQTDSALEHYMHSEIRNHLSDLETICQQTSLGEMIHAIETSPAEGRWFDKAKQSLAHGSPLSSLIIYEQLKRFNSSRLEKVFEQELLLATNIIRGTEFAEGVRALLIDKDNAPNWKFKHFSAVPSSTLEHYFSAPWPENPLQLEAV